MKPFPLVISILTSFSLSPAIAQQTLKLEPAREFYLKTKVTNPEYGSAGSKDALYVSSYHTGAGLSDATLSREITVAAKAYLNGTTLGFDFGTDFPWGFSIGTDTNYAGWESVMINAGKETNGFYFNDTDGSDDGGLKWNADYPGPVSSNNMWIGWLGEFDPLFKGTLILWSPKMHLADCLLM